MTDLQILLIGLAATVAFEYQVARVAAARCMSEGDVRAAVARHTEQPALGFLGEPRVHVLALNLDLDGLLR
jgi:potassium-transporting ATPase KdpC subunit